MSYLSAREVAEAFQDDVKFQYNVKANKGAEAGWLLFKGGAETLLVMLAEDSYDFRLALPKARFEAGEIAYLVSYDDAEGGHRYAGSFSFHRGAMFVKVLRNAGYVDAPGGWTYDVADSSGTPQTVHERDLRKADELLSQ